MIASLIWFLVNCSCSAVTSRLRLATLDDSCVSDRSVLLNDDSAYEIKLLSTIIFVCLRVLRHAHARIFAWLLGTCISETTADIAGNQTPMPEDQRELYTMQTTSAKVSRRQRHRGG